MGKGGGQVAAMAGFEAVYQAYFQDVYRYLLSLGAEQTLAEDLCQDTFLKALDHLHTFRGESALSTWLCRIARNGYYSHLRKHGRSIPVAEVPETAPGPDPASLVAGQDEGTRALALALALPEPARQIVFLRAVYGQSFKAIAALYGKSENWACVTYHRARKQLMNALEEQNEA